MCVSNYCSAEAKCDNKEDVTENSDKSLNKTANILKRKIEIKSRTKRNMQSLSYYYAQYCSDYKTYYYSYSFYCPSELDDLLSSLGSLYYTPPSSSYYSSSSGSKYSSSQYCKLYSTYYYSKSYYCPSSSSSSSSLSIGVSGLTYAASTPGNVIGAIIGVIAGVITLIVSIIIICCCCCKNKQK